MIFILKAVFIHIQNMTTNHPPSLHNQNYNISIQFTRGEIMMMMVPVNAPAQIPKAPSI